MEFPLLEIRKITELSIEALLKYIRNRTLPSNIQESFLAEMVSSEAPSKSKKRDP